MRQFNKAFKKAVEKAEDYHKAVAAFDEDIIKKDKAVQDGKKSKAIKAASAWVAGPSQDRVVIVKSYKAFAKAAKAADKQDDSSATDHQQNNDDDHSPERHEHRAALPQGEEAHSERRAPRVLLEGDHAGDLEAREREEAA